MQHYQTIIVGSGFAGICMGIKLKEAGIHDFVLLEKANEVGGTWRDNTYPGAACDVKSHLYSYSFEPKHDWSRVFSGQQEILDYTKHCLSKYGLEKHLLLNWEMSSAVFNDQTNLWLVSSKNGAQFTCNFFVLGSGALHIPSLPNIKGMDSFEGKVFHSSRWDHQYDLKGKRVAVIGTGASAIQFVPEVVPQVKQLFLFQRTAPWILPKGDAEIGALRKNLFKYLPFTQSLYRSFIYWMAELTAVGFVSNKRLMKFAEFASMRNLKKIVKEEKLRAKLTPNFTFGCKRVLMTNNYYQSLIQPNVEVITDKIEAIGNNFIQTSGGEQHQVDCIICGTGFYVTNNFQFLNIAGTNGTALNEVWKTGPEAYLGITVSGFPNLFLLAGPNTGIGHTSMIYMIEAQVRYAVDAIKKVLSKKAQAINVKAEVQDSFNRAIDKQTEQTVWASGCSSWYLDAKGRNAAIWPDFTFKYKQQTQQVKEADYHWMD